MFAHHLLKDDEYIPNIDEINLANKIINANIHNIEKGLEKQQAEKSAYFYRGMNITEFGKYTKDFLDKDSPRIL